jgi:hypothetical protein
MGQSEEDRKVLLHLGEVWQRFAEQEEREDGRYTKNEFEFAAVRATTGLGLFRADELERESELIADG